MAGVLVFSEQDTVAYELLSKARELGAANAALLGASVSAKATGYFAFGAQKVYVGEDARLADFHAEMYADALAQIVDASGAQVVLIGSTHSARNSARSSADSVPPARCENARIFFAISPE